jgi:hypothetical protein
LSKYLNCVFSCGAIGRLGCSGQALHRGEKKREKRERETERERQRERERDQYLVRLITKEVIESSPSLAFG